MAHNHTHYAQDRNGSILTLLTTRHVENNQNPRPDLLLRRKRVAREGIVKCVFVFIQVKMTQSRESSLVAAFLSSRRAISI